MSMQPRSWRPIAAAVTFVALPALLALCFASGRCGAETIRSGERTAGPAAAERPKFRMPIRLDNLFAKGNSTMQTQTRNTADAPAVHKVDTASFREAVLQADVPVLVDFYADWCGPCRQLAPVLEELARETPEARIVKVDVDASPELARQFNVSSIPTLILFRDGRPVSQMVGAAPKSTLRQMLLGTAVR